MLISRRQTYTVNHYIGTVALELVWVIFFQRREEGDEKTCHLTGVKFEFATIFLWQITACKVPRLYFYYQF